MIKAIVTDIEGTTSSISFVKDVLFPYARARLADFIRAHKDEPEVRRLIDEARQIAGQGLDDEQLIEQLKRWIDEDKKITPLKSLQGLIWAQGYREGDFQSHLYEDAVRNLKKWQAQGLKLYVFSSGSVQAQKLLFAHTPYGDLTRLFAGFFDTHIGAKKEPVAYRTIAQHIGLEPAEIIFLSDIQDELDAAKAVGFQTVWLVREGSLKSPADHYQATDFDGIIFS